MSARTSHPSEYIAWVNMKQRCYNKNNPEYFRYGGRGITVCDSWLSSFINFLEDVGEKPEKGLSLERRDNNLGYYKDNCYWAEKSTQSYNQRVSEDNSSGVTGVSFDNRTLKWKAYIRYKGMQITLGRFSSFDKAVEIRKQAEIKYYGRNVNDI